MLATSQAHSSIFVVLAREGGSRRKEGGAVSVAREIRRASSKNRGLVRFLADECYWSVARASLRSQDKKRR